jgi:DNA replication protein DnaC
MMDAETHQLLKSLHLAKMLEILDEELEQARAKDPTHQEFLVRLLRAQWHYRQEKALDWRIKRAKLPFTWTLESFPFKKQPGVSRRRIKNFASLEFVPRAENIVFMGKTGVGKTGLATGLVLKALQNGYRALFVRAAELFDEMYASLADRSTPKYVRMLSNVDLLCIDELGYLNCRPEQANIFFRLMEERYMKKPTIITTNLAFDEWHQFLGNPPMVDALLSRLQHRCHLVEIDGPSLRDPETEA